MKISETGNPAKHSPKTTPQMNSQMQGAEKSSARNQLSAKWKQHMGAAKIYWGKLSDDQLLQTEGHHQKLVGLVQERYNISREEAVKQVNKFTENNLH